VLRIDPEVEERQIKRLNQVKEDRDQAAVDQALATLASDAADPATNLMPSILDAVGTYATVGEIVDSLAGVFGRYVEDPVL